MNKVNRVCFVCDRVFNGNRHAWFCGGWCYAEYSTRPDYYRAKRPVKTAPPRVYAVVYTIGQHVGSIRQLAEIVGISSECMRKRIAKRAVLTPEQIMAPPRIPARERADEASRAVAKDRIARLREAWQ